MVRAHVKATPTEKKETRRTRSKAAAAKPAAAAADAPGAGPSTTEQPEDKKPATTAPDATTPVQEPVSANAPKGDTPAIGTKHAAPAPTPKKRTRPPKAVNPGDVFVPQQQPVPAPPPQMQVEAVTTLPAENGGNVTSEGGTNWPCRIGGCTKLFQREADLKRHQRTTKTHSRPAFACPQCGAVFTRTDALRRHQKSRHNGVIIEPSQDTPAASTSTIVSSMLSDMIPADGTSTAPATVQPNPAYYREHTHPDPQPGTATGPDRQAASTAQVSFTAASTPASGSVSNALPTALGAWTPPSGQVWPIPVTGAIPVPVPPPGTYYPGTDVPIPANGQQPTTRVYTPAIDPSLQAQGGSSYALTQAAFAAVFAATGASPTAPGLAEGSSITAGSDAQLAAVKAADADAEGDTDMDAEGDSDAEGEIDGTAAEVAAVVPADTVAQGHAVETGATAV